MPEILPVLFGFDRIGPQPFRQRIEATTPDERERLSRRFDLLVSLDRLTATVDLYREGGGEVIRLEASFEAEFVQFLCCHSRAGRGA